ncbi:uncharacterized protein LOC112347559 isoform X1 [Selaginella moellendorffii]|uniref:uncharacterized protein LOC112347559 isoform X1 n=1 Tax=Selaginella moellendorffii TaxID=88036 RepID=UPI000D1C5A0B|nr:uncharacterized protein LOC112347559 isoform X1 [Selaginella moellendorffii]|eukprot:XP_024534412.1 uncharacterized protein LOC112347559 isoform X1 [Selaginella moellendorffii]
MQSHGCRDEYYAQTGTVVEAEVVCPSGESHLLHERRCVKVLEFVEQESRAEQRRREVEHEHSNLAGQLEDLLLATGKLGVRQCRATKLLEREEDAADEEQHLRSPYVPGTRAREEEFLPGNRASRSRRPVLRVFHLFSAVVVELLFVFAGQKLPNRIIRCQGTHGASLDPTVEDESLKTVT